MSDEQIAWRNSVGEENVRYQHMSVKVIRGTEARAIAKWQAQGWDLESQTPGTLRTGLSFHRVKPKGPFDGFIALAARMWAPLRGLQPAGRRRITVGMAGVVGLLVVIAIVAGVISEADDPEAQPPPAETTTTSTSSAAMASAVPSETPSVAPPTTPSESRKPAPSDILTVQNSRDLRKLLAVKDNCSDTVERFAAKYAGQTIRFDGSVSAVTPHGNYKTRFDYLLAPGNKGSQSGSGPTFQFQNVNYSDLHLTGRNAPDSIGLDEKLRITAEVGKFNSSCLFLLEPVTTGGR